MNLMRIARLCLPLTLFATTHAWAQNADLASAEVNTCNIDGYVSITVLGITTQYPVSCINGSQQSTPGTDTASLLGTQTANVTVVNSIASVTAPVGVSDYATTPSHTTLFGETGAENVSLAQGLVGVDGVVAQLQCSSTTSQQTLPCAVYMTVGGVSINGSSASLPADPIPFGYQIPVSNLAITATVLGVPVTFSNLSGTVTLNQLNVSRTGSLLKIEHVPVAVDLTGSTQVLGIGLIGIGVHVRDPMRQLLDDIYSTLPLQALADLYNEPIR